jgi:hypothetical protein
MGRFLRLIPITRATAALWAWKNRKELGRWLGFAWRALPPSSTDRDDLLAEAKLRAALSRDERTRGLPTLAVRVADGTAILGGRLASPLHELVYAIADSTSGIRAIECRIGDRSSLGPARPHVHATSVPARVDR